MPILSAQDRAFFQRNGYVVVPAAVPQANLDAVIAALWAFLGMDSGKPDDWYRPPLPTSGMVELYQHQALWDNRQYPRVYEAFAEILNTPRLWVSFDRVNMKPPRRADHPEYDHKGFIHWDVDTSKPPGALGVQGVLCLTDTTPNMGGFQCVPELYRQMDTWLPTQPADRNPRAPDLTGFAVTPVPARAGDLIIWDRLLAHGNGHNVSDKPRLAQYITMFPARADNEDFRQKRLAQWRDRLPPDTDWAPGDPRGWEQTHGRTADLTPLGRKLLGLDAWEHPGAA